MTSEVIPNVVYEPFQAAGWLLSRHDWAHHLVDRVGGWIDTANVGGPGPLPDLDAIAEGLNAYDRHLVEWKAYVESHREPNDRSYGDERAYERAYEAWEQAGPQITDPFARAYAPMSSGEKRFFRMLGIFAPGGRVRFNLDDTNGVSLQCCAPPIYGAPAPHRSFPEDWADLIAASVKR